MLFILLKLGQVLGNLGFINLNFYCLVFKPAST